MKDFSAFLDARRCKNWAHKNLLKISNDLKTCSASFPRAQRASLQISTLSSFGGVKGQQLFDSQFNPCRGRRQVPISSSYQHSHPPPTRWPRQQSGQPLEETYILLGLKDQASTFIILGEYPIIFFYEVPC